MCIPQDNRWSNTIHARFSLFFRLTAGFCGLVIVAAGSAFIWGDLADRRAQFGHTAWLEFEGPVLLAMLAVNCCVLVTIFLIIAKRAGRG